MLELTKQQARRIAVRAQLLAQPRPSSLREVIEHLSPIQIDLVDTVASSAYLVLWSRLGADYDPAELDDLLNARVVVEHQMFLRPASDYAFLAPEMAAWRGEVELKGWERSQTAWVDANRKCRDDILELLRADGPLPAREIPDTTVVGWRSSGWNNGRNIPRMVEIMERRGEIAVAGREGRERLWDLAERVWPEADVLSRELAWAERARRRLAALGIGRASGTASPVEQTFLGDVGVQARVEGTRGTWRVDPAYLSDESFEGRVAIISPLDRLIFERKRMADLFAFDYQLEMYKPVAARRFGYYALPILDGDELVGKLDATRDDAAGLLRVTAVHRDGTWSRRRTAAVDHEIDALADWLGVQRA